MIAHSAPFDQMLWNSLSRARRRTKRKTILVLEDDEIQLKFFTKIFDPNKAIIYATSSLEDARHRLEWESYDLVLTDLSFPKQDSGFSLLASIQQNPQLKRLPVIVVSAKNDPESRDRARRLGAVDFLAKPAAPESILRSADFHLGGL